MKLYRLLPHSLTLPVLLLLGFAAVFPHSDAGQAQTAPANKKKLYISTIRAEEGASATLASRVRDAIKLGFFESFADRYYVLDDEAIKVMYKQAEAIMASGCNDTSCMMQIADGINADEIVYGKVGMASGKIRITINSLERQGVVLGTKSIVDISFFEGSLPHFCTEVSKKLVNPSYKIDTAHTPPTAGGEIKLAIADIKPVKGLDIAVMSFRTDDEVVGRIIDYLKELVSKGDEAFDKKDYTGARNFYREAVSKAESRLGDDKREKVKPFSDGVRKRIESAVLMEYKTEIEAYDDILAKKTLDEKTVNDALKKYSAQQNIWTEYKEARPQVLAAVAERIISLASFFDKRGDDAYGGYRFDEAIGEYVKAKKAVLTIDDTERRLAQISRYNEKLMVARKTAMNYTENRVRALVDQAEYMNVKDERSAAKKYIKEARKYIEKSNFVPYSAIVLYNSVAGLFEVEILSEFLLNTIKAFNKRMEKNAAPSPEDVEVIKKYISILPATGEEAQKGRLYYSSGYDTVQNKFTDLLKLPLDKNDLDLIEYTLDISKIDCNEYLIGAAHTGSIEKVKLYLKKGANINYFNERKTPLRSALEGKNYDDCEKIALFLIEKGANIIYPGEERTYLHMAAGSGMDKVVTILLNTKVGKDLINSKKNTPLAEAVDKLYGFQGGEYRNHNEEQKSKYRKSIITLINNGAHINTSYQMTMGGFNKETWISPIIVMVSAVGDTEMVKLLISRGIDVNAIQELGENQYTALSRASYEGHKDIVELLLSSGANPNRVLGSGRERETALDYAHSGHNNDIISILRKSGAKTAEELGY